LLYSHDLASPPALIRPLISRRLAEGVVQPRDEGELVFLLRLANQHKIPLTPRGRGTSGYGGAIPRYGGLVVDFSRMNKVLAIDPERLTATTQPGVVWLDMERELAPRGLALRLYPGSAPSSTVAGWLAQGGSGFGSYAYGWFAENVVCARIVQPDGKIVTYAADKLDLVRDAEGITGFISEVTLKVMSAKTLEVLTASFKSAGQLAGTLESVVEHRLKLWSLSFVTPGMANLRDKLRRQEQLSVVSRQSSVISGVYLATFVFPRAKSDIKASLQQLIRSQRGQVLEQELSDRLWGERFDLLKIKKLAPSLISTKVAVPLKSLKTALENSDRINQPLAIEGVILQGKSKTAKAVLLGFISHDERKLSYNLVYSQSLNFMKLAGETGGRPCATGIYFKGQAARIIGSSRLARLVREKKIIDPQNILNPGKVIAKDRLDLFMRLAWAFEPLTRFLANRLPPPASVGPSQADELGAVSWQAYSCDQCGFCLRNCPSCRGWESQSQRGRWYLLRLVMQGRLSLEQVINKFQPCSECEGCKISCPQGLPPVTPELLKPIELTSQQFQDMIEEPDVVLDSSLL